MTENVINVLENRLCACKAYLEFGSGGSTILAARLGVPSIISVDSSAEWVERVSNEIRREYIKYQGSITVLHADIGSTGDWGYPLDTTKITQWPSYYCGAWKLALDAGINPDLILVDGRFRVACFLLTLVHAKKGSTILFDDYVGRPEYHSVEILIRPICFHDNMAEFFITEYVDASRIMKLFFDYLYKLD